MLKLNECVFLWIAFVQDLGIQRVQIACIRLFDNEINKFSDWPMSNKTKCREITQNEFWKEKWICKIFSFGMFGICLPKYNRVVVAKKIMKTKTKKEKIAV